LPKRPEHGRTFFAYVILPFEIRLTCRKCRLETGDAGSFPLQRPPVGKHNTLIAQTVCPSISYGPIAYHTMRERRKRLKCERQCDTTSGVLRVTLWSGLASQPFNTLILEQIDPTGSLISSVTLEQHDVPLSGIQCARVPDSVLSSRASDVRKQPGGTLLAFAQSAA